MNLLNQWKKFNPFNKLPLFPSGNDNIIGSLIADALSKVGKEGVISLEEGKGHYNRIRNY